MSEIRFKALRTLHDSGFRDLDKSGDLECEMDFGSDVVYVRITEPTTIKIDCTKDGTYRLLVDKNHVELNEFAQPRKDK